MLAQQRRLQGVAKGRAAEVIEHGGDGVGGRQRVRAMAAQGAGPGHAARIAASGQGQPWLLLHGRQAGLQPVAWL